MTNWIPACAGMTGWAGLHFFNAEFVRSTHHRIIEDGSWNATCDISLFIPKWNKVSP
jgi:hypothetical protein